MSFPILTVIALLPFVGGVITMMLRGAAARATGMVFSLVTLVLASTLSSSASMAPTFRKPIAGSALSEPGMR